MVEHIYENYSTFGKFGVLWTCAYATIWSGGVIFPWFWSFGFFIDLLVDQFINVLKTNAAFFASFLFKTLLPCLLDF